MNLYGFLWNDSVNSTDHLGLSDFRKIAKTNFDCHVAVFWGHSEDTWDALDHFSKYGEKCTKATGLACNTNPNRLLRKDQRMDGFPFNSENKRCGVGVENPCTDPERGNSGRNPRDVEDPEKRSAEGWATLMSEAWEAAILQAEESCSKCECESITVKFHCTSDIATRHPGDWDKWRRDTEKLQGRYDRIADLIPGKFDFNDTKFASDGTEHNVFPQKCGEEVTIDCSKVKND